MHLLHKLRRHLPRRPRLALLAPLAAISLLGSSTAGLTTAPSWRAPLALDFQELLSGTPTLAAAAAGGKAVPSTNATAIAPPPVWMARPRAAPVLAGHPGLRLRVPYAAEIRRVARRNELDELLLASLVEVESGFHADAVSASGAIGLLQLMPEVAQEYGLEHGFDAEANLEAGARYLKDLEVRFEGDPQRALAAYFAGPTAIERQGATAPSGEARQYVDRVLAAYARLCSEEADGRPYDESGFAVADRVPINAAAGAR